MTTTTTTNNNNNNNNSNNFPSFFQGLNECLSNPCKNNAECLDLLGMYKCNCLPGYTGTQCEVDIDDCDGGNCAGDYMTCVDGINTYYCQCQPGYVCE